MQVAVAVGIVSCFGFIYKRTIDLYSIELSSSSLEEHRDLPKNILIYDINGPYVF